MLRLELRLAKVLFENKDYETLEKVFITSCVCTFLN